MPLNPTDDDTADLREWEEGEWWARLALVLGVDEIDGDGDPQSLLIDHVEQAMRAAFDAGRFLGLLDSPLYDRDAICQRAGHPIIVSEADPHFGSAHIRSCICGEADGADEDNYDAVSVTEKVAAVGKLEEAEHALRSVQ